MKTIKHITFLVGIIFLACNSSLNTRVGEDPPQRGTCEREICIVRASDSTRHYFLKLTCIKDHGWDTFPEIKFWRRVVSLSSDSTLANVFEIRKPLMTFEKRIVDSMERIGKLDTLRNYVIRKYRLEPGTRIKFTSGKKAFYRFEGVSTRIARAIEIFDSLGVDPFLAQAVLLIESPGSNRAKSTAGAYGNFQLMPFVARQYGLRVDQYVDERENFDRSAYAAARLFKEICVPYSVKMCNKFGFKVDERALWFKLLALHCYNAGSGTVHSALSVIPNQIQGDKLIQTLWHTSAGYFRSEAQNYSQLALACYLEYEKSTGQHTLVHSKPYLKF